jgi:integrase
MGSLHRHYKSPYWYYAITLPNGRRIYRSTGKKEHKEAQRFLIEQEKANDLAKQGLLTEVKARSTINDILKSVGLTPLGDTTAIQFFRDWYGAQAEVTSPNTHKRYGVVIEDFITFLGETAKLPISALEQPKLVEDFKTAQLKQGKSASTVNLAIKILRLPFNAAKRERFITINPAEEVRLIKRAPNERKVFSPAQIQNLLKVCENDWEWTGMIMLGRYAGLRLKDASNLTWGNIDLKEALLTYTPSKTKSRSNKRLVVPLKKELLEHLKKAPVYSLDKSRPLFANLYGKVTSGSGGLSLRFSDFMKKAEIDREEQTEKVHGKGRHFYGLGFHSLRHTFVSRLRNNGVDQSISKKLAGHAGEIHEEYTHWDLETLRKAVENEGKY